MIPEEIKKAIEQEADGLWSPTGKRFDLHGKERRAYIAGRSATVGALVNTLQKISDIKRSIVLQFDVYKDNDAARQMGVALNNIDELASEALSSWQANTGAEKVNISMERAAIEYALKWVPDEEKDDAYDKKMKKNERLAIEEHFENGAKWQANQPENRWGHLEKQVVELLGVCGKLNVLDCIEYIKQLQKYQPVQGNGGEGQDELWTDMLSFFVTRDIKGSMKPVIEELKQQFTITRKNQSPSEHTGE